jgi:hypothetical protein
MRTIRTHITTIAVAFVIAAVTAGGAAVAGQIINADKLNGYQANQLIRAATKRQDGAPLKTVRRGGPDEILATSITAPKRGYLSVVASSDVFLTGAFRGGPLFVSCWIGLDGGYIEASVRQFTLDDAGDAENNCATNATWPVASGQHQVQLMSDGGGIFDEASLDVIYVPFGKTGQVPDPEPVPPIKPRLSNG